jgi:putative redox protein
MVRVVRLPLVGLLGYLCNLLRLPASNKHIVKNKTNNTKRIVSRMEMEIVFPGGQRVDALMGGMVIQTDQTGLAPAPFALFLASIGTCAGIYVLSFCQQRGIPTDGVRIIQRMQNNPLTHMIERVELDIQVPPTFPEKYKDAMIRSAQLCAVKKHLENPPTFDVHTSVVEAVVQ